MAEVMVRDFEASDEEAVLRLYRETPELHKNTVADFLELSQRTLWFTKEDKIFLVAVDENGKLVGFIYVNIKPESINEEKARMLHLASDSSYRKGGIGRKLLTECARRLLDKWGITHFYFNHNEKNVAIALFAQGFGFIEVGRYVRQEVRLSPEIIERWSNPVASDWYLDGLDPDF